MISCEYRCGRMEIETIGGFEQTVPAHATVIMSGLSPFRAQLTITAGTGYSMLPPLQTCLLPGACLPGCFDLLPDASLPGCSGFLPDASLPGCFGFLPDFFPDFAKICPDSPPASLPDCFFARLPEYSALLSFFRFITLSPKVPHTSLSLFSSAIITGTTCFLRDTIPGIFAIWSSTVTPKADSKSS